MNREWTLAAVGVGLALLVWATKGLTVGEARVEYLFTVVPADASGVACASDEVIASLQCEYNGTTGETHATRVLKPFVTVSGERVLLAGVFEGAAMSAWLEDAQRKGRSDRVSVRCRGRSLGVMKAGRIRWSPASEWSPPTGLAASIADDCSVEK